MEEAMGGHSRKIFFAKLTISYKEARKTKFWIRLLNDTDYIDDKQKTEYLKDIEELLRILGSILKTSKR